MTGDRLMALSLRKELTPAECALVLGESRAFWVRACRAGQVAYGWRKRPGGHRSKRVIDVASARAYLASLTEWSTPSDGPKPGSMEVRRARARRVEQETQNVERQSA